MTTWNFVLFKDLTKNAALPQCSTLRVGHKSCTATANWNKELRKLEEEGKADTKQKEKRKKYEGKTKCRKWKRNEGREIYQEL